MKNVEVCIYCGFDLPVMFRKKYKKKVCKRCKKIENTVYDRAYMAGVRYAMKKYKVRGN